MFAFLALRFAKVPMIRDFGLLLAVGIAVICIASIVLPLAFLGIREFRSPTEGGDFSEGFLGRLTVKLGSLPQKLAVPLAVASILIFFGGIAVEDKLVLQTDPIQWVNGVRTIDDIQTLEREVGARPSWRLLHADDVFSGNPRFSTTCAPTSSTGSAPAAARAVERFSVESIVAFCSTRPSRAT